MHSRLFLFNPTNEMAIANGQISYMPPRHLQEFEQDLATLPWILGEENDFVLVPDKAAHSLDHLKETGWSIPQVVSSPQDLPKQARGNLFFEPWGWSPAVYRKFKPFFDLAHPDWNHYPFASWHPRFADLLSRETGYRLLRVLKDIGSGNKKKYPLLYLPQDPMIIERESELPAILKKFSPPLLIKTPWSASGRGIFRVRDITDDPAQSNWIKGMLRRQGKIYIEKMLDKVQDVSFQFWIEGRKINYEGHNFFYSDEKGQFAGCAIGPPENADPLFDDHRIVYDAIEQAADLIEKGILSMFPNLNYHGPAGVDGIFFRDEGGALKLHPCLEINLRHNMGLANIRLKRHIHPKAKGIWKTELFRDTEWSRFCRNRKKENPPGFSEGKLRKGFLSLTNPNGNRQFGVWLELE
ncbi:MAG: hypothetical protein ACOC1E_03340 [Marinilabiliaceae bacterium]